MTSPVDYSKLRPPAPTPEDEICACKGSPDLKLMQALSFNPVHCMECNLEVRPESLSLTAKLVESLANWCQLHAAIDHLWLESGDYEDWAARELADVKSAVNVRGRALQKGLNGLRRCYYWFFQDTSVEPWKPPELCPACNDSLKPRESKIGKVLVCEPCSIVMQGSL